MLLPFLPIVILFVLADPATSINLTLSPLLGLAGKVAVTVFDELSNKYILPKLEDVIVKLEVLTVRSVVY